MAVKQGYKQTEVGEIPEEWTVQQIGELKPFVTSGSRGWAEFYSDRGDLFIRITNLVRSSIYLDLKNSRFVDLLKNASEAARTQVQTGDILISITADIGIIGYVSEMVPKPAYINQHIALMRLDSSQTNPKYVSYFLASERPQKNFRAFTDSGAKAGMNLATVQSILVALPPTLAEQTAIAEALSDADALIDALTQLIAKKRLIKQGAMQALLSPKEGWRPTTLGNVADPGSQWSFTGGPFGSNLKSSDYTKEGVRIIQLQNIGDGEFKDNYEVYTSPEKANELLSCNIYPGEIILSKMGDPVARACIIPANHERYLMCSDGIRLAVDKKRFNTYFVYAVINAPEFRGKAENAGTGSTRKRIGLTDLRNLEILYPPLAEQTAIAAILSDMDAELAALAQKLAKARHIKQGMMQELLTGRIRLI